MTKTLTPTPDLPNRCLDSVLPILRGMLEEQREFRLEQLDELTGRGDAERGGDARSEVAAALVAGARRALHDIQTALSKMDVGEYGRCLRCPAEISVQRLSVIPETTLCVDCQRTWRPPAA